MPAYGTVGGAPGRASPPHHRARRHGGSRAAFAHARVRRHRRATIAPPDADVDRQFTVVTSTRLGVVYGRRAPTATSGSATESRSRGWPGVPARFIFFTSHYDNYVFIRWRRRRPHPHTCGSSWTTSPPPP
ncbi:hypothetical protein LT493_44420 [Streptomyces tricolor]|nr:hypothetical protein [Streptomyces tricolor]